MTEIFTPDQLKGLAVIVVVLLLMFVLLKDYGSP